MQVHSKHSLQDHVVDTVPQTFFERFSSRQQFAYSEADTALTDPRWTRKDGTFVRGFMKRALIEQNGREAADAASLTWKDIDYKGGRTSCVHVYAGNIRITFHRVPSPWSFVPPCDSRRQDAAANRFLDGYVLEGTLCAPLPELRDASAIRMYVLHGTTHVKGEVVNFCNLAVPDSELKSYCWQMTFEELQQAYIAKQHTGRVAQSIQTPKPKFKKNVATGAKE